MYKKLSLKKRRIIGLFVLIFFLIGAYFVMDYTTANTNVSSSVFMLIYIAIYLFVTNGVFVDFIYNSHKKKSDYQLVTIIQIIFFILIGMIFSYNYHGFLLENFIVTLVLLLIVSSMIFFIRRGLNKAPVYRKQKLKLKYKPSKEKFISNLEPCIKKSSSLYKEILIEVLNESVIGNLINKLPIEIVHRFYTSKNQEIIIHYEGVHKDLWFQCIFVEDGFQLLFDGFVPDNEYHRDENITYNIFSEVVDIYNFIIEAFDYHYKRVENDNLDSEEKFDKYFQSIK